MNGGRVEEIGTAAAIASAAAKRRRPVLPVLHRVPGRRRPDPIPHVALTMSDLLAAQEWVLSNEFQVGVDRPMPPFTDLVAWRALAAEFDYPDNLRDLGTLEERATVHAWV